MSHFSPLTLFVAALAAAGAAPVRAGSVYDDLTAESLPSTADAPVFAASGAGVGLAVAQALARNPQIALAASDVAAARADRFGAVGGFLPRIEAWATYTDAALRNDSINAFQETDGLSTGVTFSQPVFQGFTAVNRYREAKARLLQSELTEAQTRELVALDAARAHAAVTLARRIALHRTENLRLVARQLEIAAARMKAGAQSRTGVEQARMRKAQAQVLLQQANARRAAEEAAYRRVVGAPPADVLDEDGAEDAFGLRSLNEALAVAAQENPFLVAAEKSLAAAKYAKRAAKGDFSPSVSIDGSYVNRANGSQAALGRQDTEYQLLARMRVPIFDQGRNIAALRRASADSQRQAAQLADARLAVEETVSRTWMEIEAARLRVAAALEAREAAALSVKGLQLEYTAGRRSVIDVLDGQRDLVDAEISLSQAAFDLRAARYEIAATAGRLAGAARATSAAHEASINGEDG